MPHVNIYASIDAIIFLECYDKSGVRRIFQYLRNNNGYKGSYSTIYRVCQENNLMIRCKHRANGITRQDAATQKAENLIQQDFTAEKPNQKWLMDITEIPCKDAKLYLGNRSDHSK